YVLDNLLAPIIDNQSPVIQASLTNDTGSSNTDKITNNPTISGTVTDENAITLFRAKLDNGTFVDVLGTLQNGSFTLDNAKLREINGNTDLSQGTHSLILNATDLVGNISETFTYSFTLDSVLPIAAITSNLSNEPTSLDVTVSEVVSEAFYAQSSYSLKVVGGANDGQSVVINALTKVSDTLVRLSLATPLTAGNYQLAIASEVKDTAGNSLANQTLDFTATPPTLAFAPLNGEGMVSLTRDGVVRFGTKVKPETVTNEAFYLIANGQRLAGKVKVSSTNEFATFLPDEILPASTEVRMVVDGSKILSQSGVAIDADGDGLVGGIGTADFTTLPIVRIAGTDVWGYVYDSYNKNPDGSNIPIKGVTIRLDALPNVFAVTDDKGYFILEDVPAPDFYVYIDGSTATGAPEATQYASLGKPFHSVPGQSTQLCMDGLPFDVYLPPMAASDVKPLSTTEATQVGFGEFSQGFLQQLFPDVDPDVWTQVQVTFVAGSAQDDGGNAATQAMIIPVDPQRLPAPLPPGVDPQLVISIQAGGANGFNREADGGATTFDVPAPIQFPNLEGLKPGEKSLFWSFDHDAGKWIVIGTGTVSEDGKVIKSDPGVGVLAPGWHFVNPGVPANGDPPKDPDKPDWNEIQNILKENYQSKKGTAGAALAHQIQCIADISCQNEATWGGGFVKDVFQDIATTTRDLDITDFLPNVLSGGLGGLIGGRLGGWKGGVVGGLIGGYGDRIIEKLPNWVLGSGNLSVRLGDLSAVLGGFGRHFPYELLPGFARHCAKLTDSDHNNFFDQAVVPCFDTLVNAGELSPWAGKAAQALVPLGATALRETIQAICPVLQSIGIANPSSINGNLGIAGVSTFAANEFPTLPSHLTKEQLYSQDIASISTLDVSANGNFFLPVGDQIQLQVTKKNADGTISNLTSSATGTKYFAVIGDETIEVTKNGLLSILSTISPFTSLTPSLYILVRNGDDIGIGQFAVTDVDTDGDLIVDSYERKFGLDPNAKNALSSDLDKDGLTDLEEILYGIDPQ
ncbi:MAG: Ig-like domain-containing protein, partial [Dolichospermum sp.]